MANAELDVIRDQKHFDEIVCDLANRSTEFASAIVQFGQPKWWKRPATFETLIRIILEQQVSLAAGKTVYQRLRQACSGRITVASLARLRDEEIRNCGLSGPKTRYVRNTCEAADSRKISIARFRRSTDDEVLAQLTSIVGIGNWTAEVFLMSALRRSDLLPVNDLGLIVGVKELWGLDSRPSSHWLSEWGEQWRPYRTVATQIVWHNYLSLRKRK